MRDWLGVFERLNISLDKAARIAARAHENGTSFHVELRAAGLCDETLLYRAVAADLGLIFLSRPVPSRLMIGERDVAPFLSAPRMSGLLYFRRDGMPLRLLGDDVLDLTAMRRWLKAVPERRRQVIVVARSSLRGAVLARASNALGVQARDALSTGRPHFSARVVANAWQGCVIGALLMGMSVTFALWPGATLIGLHAFFSIFFLACVYLRFRAAREAAPPFLQPLPPARPDRLPTYSILIALYREAEVVPELLKAMNRIEWPRSKLEVKLVCEADDEATLEALRRQSLPPFMEVVAVPAIGPRTKPKALAYALPMTSGEFVGVYDAEDKPHSRQLLEAWQRFAASDAKLACLQAPLIIANGRENMLARLFSFEYAALFRGILPWLSKRGLVLPLGGTSNHFRRSALTAVGGWDPFNVTEDADLGLRLARFGYRSATITYPTFEDAPVEVGVWLRQRTRWLKGWLQTWLVHMRSPLRLRRDVGTSSFLMVQILFLGMVLSAAFHPLILLTIGAILVEILAGREGDPMRSILFAVDSINITCGYAAFLVLGVATLVPHERKKLWKVILATPVYWMLISLAAWRSAWQLYRKPFLWEKTPHRARGLARFSRPAHRRSTRPAPGSSSRPRPA